MAGQRQYGIPLFSALVVALAATAACGAVTSPTPTATPQATSIPSASATPTPSLAATTSAQLEAVAMSVYPPCTSNICSSHGTKFTTCASGMTATTAQPGDPFSACPLTPRLKQQFKNESVPSGADPLGGGQDEEFISESFSSAPSASGGVVHVTLSFEGNGNDRPDLVLVDSAGTLLVDDIYCTGQDPSSTDAYASGWLNRSTCSS